jgi:hypothetical protein
MNDRMNKPPSENAALTDGANKFEPAAAMTEFFKGFGDLNDLSTKKGAGFSKAEWPDGLSPSPIILSGYRNSRNQMQSLKRLMSRDCVETSQR